MLSDERNGLLSLHFIPCGGESALVCALESSGNPVMFIMLS